MKLAMVGLGKMGANMVERLLAGGHEVVAFDLRPEAVEEAVRDGAAGAGSPEEVVARLGTPRVVWIMVPAGAPVDGTIGTFAPLLEPGDLIVDGGNSRYTDTVRRAGELGEMGIDYVDAGTSGGVWGLKEGYSLMVGGPDAAVERLRPALETLAPGPDLGWGHVGPSGAGHFVKMIHNGIEYGMMQAYAEGFSILRHKEAFNLDLHQIAEIWRHGSVVRSWLLDLAARALAEDQTLDDIAPYVSDSGEGRWTVFEAIDQSVPAPVIALSLMARFRSRDEESYGDRLLAALRNQFGGHAMKPDEDA